jgi:exopolysaccharide biosynthesis polyprenyl glycosylphosphotransferase
MQQNVRIDHDSTARFDALGSPFVLQGTPKAGLHLRPAVARAISGPLIGTADLVCLSVMLIYLALWASGVTISGNLVALLSVRLSVGHFLVIALCWIVWRTIFYYCGLYTWQHVQSARGVPGRVALATGVSALLACDVVGAMWHHGRFVRLAVYFWIATMSAALLTRVAVCLFQLYVRPHFRQRRHAVIVGGGPRAARFLQELKLHPEWDYQFIGYVDSTAMEIPGQSWPLLGRISDLEEILMRQVVDEVVVALPVKTQYAAIDRTISICERAGVQVQYCEDLFDTPRSSHCYREQIDNQHVVLKMVQDDYRHRIKRAVDLAGATFGLILCAPLFLIVAILIKATSNGPIFFTQDRYGLGKRTFRIHKFRTMVVDAEAAQGSLEHMNETSGPVFKIFKDPRITKVGAILRRTSIDELPQLFNVVKGEMSLVGPRPLCIRDVGRFSEGWLMRRFSVKPGLTCLWQISGRSNVNFDRWIELDLHYIDNWSLQMDMQILARTIPAVLKGTGAA